MNSLYKYASLIITISSSLLTFGYSLIIKYLTNLSIIDDLILIITLGAIATGLYFFVLIKFINNITRFKLFRKRIFKDYLIEGYWLFETLIDNDIDSSPFSKIGVGEIRFNNNKKEFETTVVRRNPNLYNTNSQTVSMNFDTLLYVNFSELSDNNVHIEILAHGKFSISANNKLVDYYTGWIMQLDKNEPLNNKIFMQRGTRISESLVNVFQEKYGKNWIEKFIEEQEKLKKIT